ncbi:hypothetical protein BP5796_08878 [Coleophoma crateriformis]|uniref:Uncharacterized protein n=1 Tax=Coleophoma crateriformis TaxID=565419 RepID=A0A3D8R2S3_9HELO|nr:hypothetical protein BP5796_08878 [Coleophoma crateriformis]
MDSETTHAAPGLFFGLDDASDDDLDLDETSCTIGLNNTGEDGSAYHIRNNPANRFQRETVTDQTKGAIQVRCKSREVVHGCLDASTGELGTLLVYDFTFNAAKLGRRIVSADITLNFSASIPGMASPTVHSFAPSGRCVLQPTSRDESSTQGTDISANAGQLGITIGTAWKWEKTITQTTSDATELRVFTKCNEFGDEVGVNWVLHENRTVKSGIPSFLRTAILLKREDVQEFEATINVVAEPDWKSQLRRLFGSKDEDEPILFNPQQPPTKNLRPKGYDVENLSKESLADLADVTFYTKIEGAVK